jgi:RNA polymerase sigma-70 factor (ECF subfamily)
LATPESIETAARAWPDLRLSPEGFAAYLQARAEPPAGEAGLAELYLAFGCSQGDATALALFDARYLDVVPMALAHMHLSAHDVDEVRQLVRGKLLVAEPGQATKLDAYAGRGQLRGLIQVVAVRAAISLLRGDRRHRGGGGDLGDLPSPAEDPELRFLKEQYREAFKRCFERALGELSSRDRNFLRLHHFGGLTVEQVGAVYGVHRATATRWLAKIREQLLGDTRRHLGETLSAPSGEIDGIMELIQSRLDVSVQRLLDSREEDGGVG